MQSNQKNLLIRKITDQADTLLTQSIGQIYLLEEILGYPQKTECVLRAPVKKSQQNNEERHFGKDIIPEA